MLSENQSNKKINLIEYLDSIRFYRAEIAKIEPKWENEIVIIPDTELERLYYA